MPMMAYGDSGGFHAFAPAASMGPFSEALAPAAITVRTDFPESWIWQTFSNER